MQDGSATTASASTSGRPQRASRLRSNAGLAGWREASHQAPVAPDVCGFHGEPGDALLPVVSRQGRASQERRRAGDTARTGQSRTTREERERASPMPAPTAPECRAPFGLMQFGVWFDAGILGINRVSKR